MWNMHHSGEIYGADLNLSAMEHASALTSKGDTFYAPIVSCDHRTHPAKQPHTQSPKAKPTLEEGAIEGSVGDS